MKINQLHPELRRKYRLTTLISVPICLYSHIFRFLGKITPKPKKIGDVIIENRKIGNINVRIYVPKKLSGAGLLHIHGGGYITGYAAMDDKLCATCAEELGAVVVSAGYRLAPENPFPDPLNDCFEAWQWFLDEAETLGVDTTRIAIMGKSAGGGLAASLTQKILDEGEAQPVAQVLLAPMLDDKTALRYELDKIKHKIWDNKKNRYAWKAYLGTSPWQLAVPPYAAPARRENLVGLPPTWIGVGDLDLFYEENRQYAERLNKSGVSCQLYTVPSAPHSFETIAPKALISRDFYHALFLFLEEALKDTKRG